MHDGITAKLEASRKELLDLGLRNPLINYRTPKARGLQIVQEKSEFIYDILVKQAKAMTFLGIPEKKGERAEEREGVPELPVLSQPQLEEAYHDTRLQTNESEQKLQARLLNTFYFSKSSIEEQGVNILYLALGMLKWFDPANGETVRYAPLVLVPVSLERSSAQERFRLRYTGGEIGPNLSLQAKMKVDFNITIPDFADDEDFNISGYFEETARRIAGDAHWSVEADSIELGFFSFGKFMIYNDLDCTRWPEGHHPTKHPNIASLFETGFDEDYQPLKEEDKDLDEETNANDLYRVLDADSSQVLAMLAVNRGHNMVIQGPPGTGKSQTITNIIANAVGQGKKVLFVAEKMAALEVVKRRLDNIQLGEACLELHSHKSNKKELHEELKRVLELGKPTLTLLEQEVQLLAAYRAELNSYCNAVNTSLAGSGLSPQQIIGFLLKIDKEVGCQKLIKLSIENISHWTAEQMRAAEEMCDRIQARLRDIGVPEQLLFWGSRLTVLLPHEKEPVLQQLNQTRQAVSALYQLSETIAERTGMAAPEKNEEVNMLLACLKMAALAPDIRELDVKNDVWLLKKQDISELIAAGKQLDDIYRIYKDVLLTEAWSADILEIRRNLVVFGQKWYKFLVGSYRRSNQKLASFLKTSLPQSVAEKLKIVDAISEARRLELVLRELEPFATAIFGKRWLKQRSDWDALSKAAHYLCELHQQIAEGKYPHGLLNYISRGESADIANRYYHDLDVKLKASIQQTDAGLDSIAMDETLIFSSTPLRNQPFVQQIDRWTQWITGFAELQRAIDWNILDQAAATAGFSFLLKAAAGWDDAPLLLKTALQQTWYQYLIEQAFLLNPPLTLFERVSHEEILEKFKKLDQTNLHYNRARVALKHWEAVPRFQAGGQVNILRTEFNKKARHMPIRKLVEEAGLAIQAIKPVWMMSPMSIANFLPPGSIHFDLVIFDEASQVRPVEALGAIMRAEQLVVVGDTRQLPPTSFFDKLNDDTDDEDNMTADMQSILGMCDGQGAPGSMLRWHYRSMHESLISLSNHEFYEDKLVIFPSPGSRQNLGLRFHYLADAVYDRGKTRTNPVEAEKVAEAVMAHARNSPDLSLGVVAFSTSQMQAIQTALEIQRRKDPGAEIFFKKHPDEPFFVKNLENVQGDERDVIFISLGYGRVENGTVPMSFGPLNNDGGERRLNVLITRAKMRCEVFTNITANDIKLTESSKFGIKALRNFLYFAQFGRLDHDDTILPPEVRPFEDLVASGLAERGYIVRNKVGTSGFYLDLAIVDDKNPGRYILGIECDGANYARAKSATDRDRLRAQVLELFGWKIHRIWSTDWYRNPERELKRLVEAIEQAKSAAKTVDEETEAYEEEQRLLQREQPKETSLSVAAYQLAALPAAIGQQEIHLYSFGQLGEWITEVVQVESPVHFDEMARRMAETAGISKVGSRIKYTLTQASRFAEQSGAIQIKGDFLWDLKMDVPQVRDRSNLPPASKKLQYIAPEEIVQAIICVVEQAIAITSEAAVPLVARLFGFARVTEEMKQALLEIIRIALETGAIKADGNYLKYEK